MTIDRPFEMLLSNENGDIDDSMAQHTCIASHMISLNSFNWLTTFSFRNDCRGKCQTILIYISVSAICMLMLLLFSYKTTPQRYNELN